MATFLFKLPDNFKKSLGINKAEKEESEMTEDQICESLRAIGEHMTQAQLFMNCLNIPQYAEETPKSDVDFDNFDFDDFEFEERSDEKTFKKILVGEAEKEEFVNRIKDLKCQISNIEKSCMKNPQIYLNHENQIQKWNRELSEMEVKLGIKKETHKHIFQKTNEDQQNTEIEKPANKYTKETLEIPKTAQTKNTKNENLIFNDDIWEDFGNLDNFEKTNLENANLENKDNSELKRSGLVSANNSGIGSEEIENSKLDTNCNQESFEDSESNALKTSVPRLVTPAGQDVFEFLKEQFSDLFREKNENPQSSESEENLKSNFSHMTTSSTEHEMKKQTPNLNVQVSKAENSMPDYSSDSSIVDFDNFEEDKTHVSIKSTPHTRRKSRAKDTIPKDCEPEKTKKSPPSSKDKLNVIKSSGLKLQKVSSFKHDLGEKLKSKLTDNLNEMAETLKRTASSYSETLNKDIHNLESMNTIISGSTYKARALNKSIERKAFMKNLFGAYLSYVFLLVVFIFTYFVIKAFPVR